MPGFISSFNSHIRLISNSNVYSSFPSKESNFSKNIDFLDRLGINLKMTEEVKNKLLKMCSNSKEDKIDSLLQNAYYEISLNPESYSDLIITAETLKDDKKYTLVKKSNK